ncbi:GNAT family N-acetyltransferase [Candidatus Pacearchaeota archaeon]|nr:GNAT family N-acetyltransferase [Candidatus Pacearchaeota archaeon]
MNIILKKSSKSELKSISKIYMNEFSKPPYNEKWTYNKAYERINFYFKYYDLYSIFLDGRLVGFASVNSKFMCPGEVAYGEEVAIVSEFQGKGIGKNIMEQIFEIYKKKGFKRFLCLVNKKGNSIKMFKKLNVNASKSDILLEKKLR